ncbi:MAG: hypothetical protein GY768_09380 [Planctomycetaceae bacterium]|nr:hypothetical protein [Planctomycetaceae bacterium]
MRGHSSSSQAPVKRRRNPTVRFIRLGIVLSIVAYVCIQPWLEQRFGWSLPSFNERQGELAVEAGARPAGESQNDKVATRLPSAHRIHTADQLNEIQPNLFESPAGLIYAPGSQQGHRLKHVLAHSHDQPNRPGQHGVFSDASQNSIVGLIDEAYRRAQQGNSDRSETDSDRQVWTVDMGREIGFVGGQVGRQRGHPKCRYLRIVLDGNRVITAYPVQQRNR